MSLFPSVWELRGLIAFVWASAVAADELTCAVVWTLIVRPSGIECSSDATGRWDYRYLCGEQAKEEEIL